MLEQGVKMNNNIKIKKSNPIAPKRLEKIFKDFVESKDYEKFSEIIRNLEKM